VNCEKTATTIDETNVGFYFEFSSCLYDKIFIDTVQATNSFQINPKPAIPARFSFEFILCCLDMYKVRVRFFFNYFRQMGHQCPNCDNRNSHNFHRSTQILRLFWTQFGV